MKRLTLALGWLLIASAARAENKPQDILYLADSGPVVIRMYIQIDGESLEKPWLDYVDSMFKNLDKNSDGKLTGDEAKRIPNAQQLSQIGLRLTRFNPATRPTGNVTKKQLDEYLRKIGGGPFSFAGNAPAQTQRVRLLADGRVTTGAAQNDIFKKLDTNDDGKLNSEEFGMSSYLRKLDLDDDETISTTELQPAANPYMYYGRQQSGSTSASNKSFIHLNSEQSSTTIARKLLAKYDRKIGDQAKDNKLSSEEFGYSLDKFDMDKNGALDVDELQKWADDPQPRLVTTLRLGDRDGKAPLDVKMPASDSPLADRVTKTESQATLASGKVRVEINMPTSNVRYRVANFDRNYKQMLKQYDTDNNAYLEKKEVERTPFRTTFEFIDSDGDGKIFEKELLAYGRQVATASRSRTTLNVVDQGNKLFEILDLNRDNRLNRRELEAARAKIAVWDEDEDAQVTRKEIPRYWRLSVSRGQANYGYTALAATPYGYAARPGARPTGGPSWFVKMDRNRDGDVTRREFLGDRDEFEKIDSDRDGTINAKEAAAVK